MSQNASTNSESLKTSVAAHLRRVSTFEQQGMYEEAIETLKKVIDLAPDNAKHCIRLARLYHAQRKFEPAIAAMQKAIDLDPRNTGAQESLLQIYLEIGRYDEAIDSGKKFLRRYPRNLYARDILGVAYLQKGQIDEAMHVTNELINLDPMDAGNHFKKAVLFQQKGDFARAMQEFLRVLDMDPEGELAEESREAVAMLDSHQLRQIVVLAAEDPVFRAKIIRDSQSAIAERGFTLSETGMLSLNHIAFDSLQGEPDQPQQKYYN